MQPLAHQDLTGQIGTGFEKLSTDLIDPAEVPTWRLANHVCNKQTQRVKQAEARQKISVHLT